MKSSQKSKRLTLDQAADFLRLPPSELRSLAVQGHIASTQSGDRFFFSQDDLDIWISRKIIAFQSLNKADQHKERKTLKIPDTSQPFLDSLLTPETVCCNLSGRSKPSVLKALTELAVNSGYVYDPNDLYVELLEREENASTTIEHGAAIPHPHHRFNTPLFDDSFICLARLNSPIFYGNSPDGEKTDLFFLVCCLDSDLHIQVIARICQLCLETSLLQELRLAQTDQELYDTFITIDQHPEQHPFGKLKLSDQDSSADND